MIKLTKLLITSKTTNRFLYPFVSFFAFNENPITISTIPTIKFPIPIESVDNISTFCC